MPHASVNGVELFYEITGEGPPLVFCHEFAGDYRAWDPQVRAFARLYRCITYCHRGFPPSSVPTDPAAYSQDLLIADLLGLLDHLQIERAHLVGFSMGGNVVLNFAMRYPERCHGIVVVGTGSGSTNRERFLSDVERTVGLLRSQGIAGFADTYSRGPTRLPFLRKDPRGWAVFRQQLEDHSAEGQALIMLGVMVPRPTIFALEPQLEKLTVPTLLMTGDEDEPCLEPALLMKRKIASSGLLVVPQTGHAINLEEPALFNRAVLDFLHLVEACRWATRAAVSSGLLP
ncbi:MAG TPA: alpha/beta hydrolase [Chloroflexota bacterium]|jgi:pimeloyl-ACP methyl ester carboxylesterase|nr:alpha/beta hydrolase [Chloroflexota bacterium]